MQSRRALPLLFLFLLMFLHACGSTALAPVEAPGEREKKAASTPPSAATIKKGAVAAPERKTEPEQAPARMPAYHVVNKGDTLYSIAWNYGFDYREVAAWNTIKPPYTIYPGQRIYLRGRSKLQTSHDARSARKPDVTLTPGPIIIKRQTQIEVVQDETTPVPAPEPVQAAPPPSSAVSIIWTWPTPGNIVKTDTPIAKNGIDIAGALGQQINASAPGEVVYSGSGLLGYGKLIIIKHNDIFLSAYAHNSELLVQEGDQVSGGQNIALMGEASNGKAILHFEIRENGQPVDPLKYLPANH